MKENSNASARPRVLLAFLGVFMMSSAVPAMAEEHPLQPVDRPVISGELRCMPFFVATTFGGAAAEQIIFSFQAPDGSARRDTIPKARVSVQLVDQAPTYEKAVTDGQGGVVFRLNKSDYERARACLPEPRKAP